MPRNNKRQSRLQTTIVGGEKEPPKTPQQPNAPQVSPQEPVKEPAKQKVSKLDTLRQEAVVLGMAPDDAQKFESVELLAATINALNAAKASVLSSIPNQVNPKEEKETEDRWRGKAARQKAFFDSQPKVRTMIPLEGTEKAGVVEERMVNGKPETVVVSGAVWSKTFNGYKVTLPKGRYIEVAEGIADNIAQEFNQIQESLERFGIDRTDPKTGRRVGDQL